MDGMKWDESLIKGFKWIGSVNQMDDQNLKCIRCKNSGTLCIGLDERKCEVLNN